MAIAIRANGSATRDASSGATLTKPTGALAGDLMVISLSWDAGGTLTAPAGWTALATNVGNTSMKAAAYYRVVQAGDTSWSWTWTSAPAVGWVVQTFSSEDTTTPIDATGTTSTNTAAASITANAVTVVTSQAIEVIANGAWNGSTVFSATGFTVINNGATANQPASLMYNLTGKATGSTGTVTCTGSGSASGQILTAIPFALRPAAGAPPAVTANPAALLMMM
jgi:archaellum component FlaF (FlaF/FlaG flagellin family)